MPWCCCSSHAWSDRWAEGEKRKIPLVLGFPLLKEKKTSPNQGAVFVLALLVGSSDTKENCVEETLEKMLMLRSGLLLLPLIIQCE